MKYSGILYNDFSAAPGVSLTVFLQGCPHRCPGCHNPETWDFDGGKEFTTEVLNDIKKGLKANGIERTLCIMGGEPLCPENLFLTNLLISEIKNEYPEQKIYVWTGYTYEELQSRLHPKLKEVLELIDVLIDGPYIAAERDITLPMRGSRNQRVIDLSQKK
jgi:anaerobic ribonucleoside-triphosphate reductase activating protein